MPHGMVKTPHGVDSSFLSCKQQLTCTVPVKAGVQVTLGLLWSQPSLSSFNRSQAKMVGSFLYCSPLMVLFRFTMVLMWSVNRLMTAGLLKKSAVPVTLLFVSFAQFTYCTAWNAV